MARRTRMERLLVLLGAPTAHVDQLKDDERLRRKWQLNHARGQRGLEIWDGMVDDTTVTVIPRFAPNATHAIRSDS